MRWTNGPSELYVAVTPGPAPSPTFFLSGTVTNPNVATFFLANWWVAARNQDTRMATEFPAIRFDFTSDMALHTASNNFIGRLIGGTKLDRFPVSFRGAFEQATMRTTRR